MTASGRSDATFFTNSMDFEQIKCYNPFVDHDGQVTDAIRSYHHWPIIDRERW